MVAGRLLEGGWLAVAATVPLSFSILDWQSFEPDKAMLLRSLCAAMALAWLVRALARRTPLREAGWARREPLLIAVALFLGATALSTATSVARWDSLAGSYLRSQGLYTVACYAFVAVAVAFNLRTAAQVNRLVGVAILASVPMALYGILQSAGVDPLEWTTDWKGRAASTQGNPVFLGAILCMVAPLTLVRLGATLSAVRERPGRRDLRGLTFVGAQLALLAAFVLVGAARNSAWWAAMPVLGVFLLLVLLTPTVSRAVAAAGYAAALGLQVAALVLSQSRGPLLGLLAACSVVALAAAVMKGGRALRLAAAGTLALAAAGLTVLNLWGGAAGGGRLTELFETDAGSGRIRVLIWEGALELVTDHPVANPAGDRLNALRPLVGYGPETFRDVYGHVYQPELGRLDTESRFAVPDRAHNALLDSLVAGGALGLVAYLLVFNLFFAAALERLGLVAARSRNRVRALVGITGLPGAVGYLLYLAWRGPPGPSERSERPVARPAALGFLAAGVAHFVETLVGFGTISSLSLAWLAIGAVVALRFVRASPAEAPSRERLAWPAAYAAATVAAVAATAAWDPARTFAPPLLLLAGFAWLAGALAVWHLARDRPAPAASPGRARRPALAVGFAAVAALVALNGASVGADVHFRDGVELESRGEPTSALRAYRLAVDLAPRNDVYRQRYGALLARHAVVSVDREGSFRRAEASLREALELAPTDPFSYAGLARLYRTRAATEGGERRAGLLDRAVRWYGRALGLAPRSYVFRLELGRTQILRGDYRAAVAELSRAIAVQPAPEPRRPTELRGDAYLALADYPRALADYTRTLALRPQRESRRAWRVHRNLAIVHARLGNVARARRELATAEAAAPAAEREAIEAVGESLELRGASSRPL